MINLQAVNYYIECRKQSGFQLWWLPWLSPPRLLDTRWGASHYAPINVLPHSPRDYMGVYIVGIGLISNAQ